VSAEGRVIPDGGVFRGRRPSCFTEVRVLRYG